ncbi:hypothetical protein DL769_003520 [Monosporascus sp. CRB-8-3]|nr:hypothetical protein DL769_003520 [Monosporascus sp. CRB-8-3]
MHAPPYQLFRITNPRRWPFPGGSPGSSRGWEKESETLQNITGYFVPLMKNLRICFFWEQEKTDLKHTRDFIVQRESAALNFDDTERAGSRRTTRGGLCSSAALSGVPPRGGHPQQALAKDRRSEISEKLRSIQSSPYKYQLPKAIPSTHIGGREYRDVPDDKAAEFERSQASEKT